MATDILGRTRVVPHRFIEYGFYFSMFYSIMGPALGLSISGLGAGLAAGLAVLCLFTLGSRTGIILSSIGFPLGCAVSFILVQEMWHGEAFMGPYVRPFITWIFYLIIIQSLVLRKGFLHRFSVAMFLIGLTLLPNLTIYAAHEEVQRFGLDREVGLASPNAFAAWFGFCGIYFALLGIETKQKVFRILIWLLAFGCLFLVTLTVSRGAIFAAAVAIVIGSRHLLRKGFVPILVLAVLGFGFMQLGVFDDALRNYGERGTEDSGRLLVWPLIFERFLDSPILGVGVSHIGTFVPLKQRAITPHNGFLFLALASGIVPLVFFSAYWLQAFWRSFHQSPGSGTDDPFLVPILIYAFLQTLQSNTTFMEPWAIMGVAMMMTGRQAVGTDNPVGGKPRVAIRKNEIA